MTPTQRRRAQRKRARERECVSRTPMFPPWLVEEMRAGLERGLRQRVLFGDRGGFAGDYYTTAPASLPGAVPTTVYLSAGERRIVLVPLRFK